MTGLPNIAEKIPKEARTLEERGLAPDSYYIVEFEDGSMITELDTNWSDFSEVVRVGFFGGEKDVRIAKYPVKRISVLHDGLSVDLVVPEGQQVYQAVRSQIALTAEENGKPRALGRSVGLVLGGEVIEERFINGRTHEVFGMRL